MLDDLDKRLLSSLLHLAVNREDHIRAALCLDRRGIVEHVAVGVNIYGLLATHALQHALVLELDARLPDCVARLVGNGRIARVLLRGLKLLGRRASRVPQHMGAGGPKGIVALGALLDVNALEEMLMLVDIGDRTT